MCEITMHSNGLEYNYAILINYQDGTGFNICHHMVNVMNVKASMCLKLNNFFMNNGHK